MSRQLQLQTILLRLVIIAFVALVLACLCVGIVGLNDNLGKADVALVLGNKVDPNGQPSPSLRARLDRTLECYRQGWFPMIVVSGGLGKEGFDEAVVMRNYLMSHGVSASRIIADSQGWTTYDSAKNLSAMMKTQGWKSAFVVTQYYHVPRSCLALRKFGIGTVFSAHAYYFGPKDLIGLPREVAGLIQYGWRKY